jgi:hypothetical protein
MSQDGEGIHPAAFGGREGLMPHLSISILILKQYKKDSDIPQKTECLVLY